MVAPEIGSLWTVGGLAWLAGVVVSVGGATAGFARVPRLAESRTGAAAPAPRGTVSVIVAARNEAVAVAGAVRSVLASRGHAGLEVVAVDDRSSDGTAQILEAVAADDPRLRVLHVAELPPGWLGKTHALQRGARMATGDWLLFTDADVHFQPEAVAAAVAFAERGGLDHVTALPAVEARGPGLRIFMVWLLLVFSIWRRPWQAARPGSRASAGLGAFNLVRRAAYWDVGGHATIALALADDVALGGCLKAAGYRQSLVVAAHAAGLGRPRRAAADAAPPLLRVPWYPDLGAAVRGFEKNSFAMFRFQPWSVAAWAAFGALCVVLPPAAVVWAPGWQRLPWLAGYLFTAGCFASAGRTVTGRFPWRDGLFFPAAQAGLVWTALRSAVLTLRRGGVRWRDTFYPLEALREAEALLHAATYGVQAAAGAGPVSPAAGQPEEALAPPP